MEKGCFSNGKSLCFGADSFGCGGAKRYLDYTTEVMPGFEYFLSCGIEGRIEGERYKITPEMDESSLITPSWAKVRGRLNFNE
jgi:hypothetical protein